ncbi:citrate lyase subunit alpha [Desulfovibrio sp. OttesenSCG-928-O18]|nr:citrate lyase subunit alpha [Desulfovibrio sp. OttesenSCG-928-O18]
MKGKLIASIEEAIKVCGLKDGMTVSFHHHLRDGDQVLPMVMATIKKMGFRDIKVSASSIHNSHGCLAPLIEEGVVTGIDTNFLHRCVGETVSRGAMAEPAIIRTHGHRPRALETGEIGIDIAFIAASAADNRGNMNGVDGPSAFGSMGHAFADAQHAKKVVCVTDYLVEYPLAPVSIDETWVDYVVKVDSIGDTSGINSGITTVSRDPVGLHIAKTAVSVIEASGILKDGFVYQTGGGRTSLATTKFMKDAMKRNKVTGRFILGGINSLFVELLEEGYFENILDCQCFDPIAAASLKNNPRHQEISCSRYANFGGKSCAAAQLDTVMLGATEIDTNFNVNVHTDSSGVIMGGSGGHSDIAFGAKITVIVTPLMRARSAIVVDKVTNLSTPGECVDILVTQRGIAVNPKRGDLKDALTAGGFPVKDIHELRDMAKKLTGEPKPLVRGEKVVAKIVGQKGMVIDEIRQVVGR